MNNVITKIGKSIIQHDKENNRIYLMKMHEDDICYITNALEDLAREKKYTKVIAKVPFNIKSIFVEKGYSIEAVIPKFYKGKEAGTFIAKYFSKDRREKKDKEIIECVLNKAIEKSNEKNEYILSEEFNYRKAHKKDAEAIAKFYENIFETYPFPVYNYKYIEETIKDNIVYFTIWKDDKLVAVSSSEMDEEKLNVEMTDFGVLPQYRGKGFAVYLLEKMEEEMKSRGIKMAYSIARAVSFGMNVTFSKKEYTFAGTLVNNTNISGGIESMNVWYKEI
ncbi:putative beta-lysine N-acetyltransferase [Clostridium ganghwense]|uniref:Beta-lysine N-acetyltransferase n=1 Tax=Clostridium ganghwense TaxID=312089 RepID=A0ABT4CTQ0_9CLOT|nr:putative beta-lysine N-acetyltransferase [Clostridium ganghwense]MCY6371416.1 putative beta-lysine N-acetyltransferase [Clostridium ganghwense]